MFLEWKYDQVGGPRAGTITFRSLGDPSGTYSKSFTPFTAELVEEYRGFFRSTMQGYKARLQNYINDVAGMNRYKNTHFNVYYRITAPQVYFGVTVTDPDFFYKEWDTKPHWPPFGAGTDLHNWAIAQGWLTKGPRGGWKGSYRLFALARSMAPLEGGKRWRSSRGNWVGATTGDGGRPIGRRGRSVATAGAYQVTSEVNFLANEMMGELDGMFQDWFDAHGV